MRRLIDIIQGRFNDILSKLSTQTEIQNTLYGYIVEKYEEITCQTISDEPKEAVCETIWVWYYSKYYQKNVKKKQGLSRSISRVTTEDEYYFDIPYKKTQFIDNLLGNNRVEQEFIKQVCVAFNLDQGACSDCLTAYGYLPLHSKNLHDLAIYSVMSTMNNADLNSLNPLSLVKERYLRALELIKNSHIKLNTHEGIETVLLTSDIENTPEFDETHFRSYVEKNVKYLNWLHSAVLDEHNRLVKVFQYLYDKRRKGADWPDEASRYSLFSFVNKFCKDIDYGHFSARLIKDIQNDRNEYARANRHPTREIMIILWLYEEFFRGSEKLLCPPKYTASIEHDFWKSVRINGEDKTEFYIHKYLFGKDIDHRNINVTINGNRYEGRLYFNGAEVKSIINYNLYRYGYSVLSSKRSYFDAIIMKLLELKIYQASPRVRSTSGGWNYVPSYYCEFCGNGPINLKDDYDYIIENYKEYNIPISLALFFEILNSVNNELKNNNCITDAEEQTAPNEDTPTNYLLSCNLSSQL